MAPRLTTVSLDIAASNAKGLQAGSLLVNGQDACATPYISIQTHACVLIPTMMFYDVKLPSTETPVAVEYYQINMPMFISNTKLLYKPKSFSTADHLYLSLKLKCIASYIVTRNTLKLQSHS